MTGLGEVANEEGPKTQVKNRTWGTRREERRRSVRVKEQKNKRVRNIFRGKQSRVAIWRKRVK
jgi:hypothetical protein